MLEPLENLQDKGMYIGIIICIAYIAFSGIFFGITYFALDTTHTSLQTVECTIDNNYFFEDCQDLFSFALFPFLELKSILVWASYFFIFGLVIALLVLGYRSGSSAVMMGVMISFLGALVYFALLLSNMYRTILENEIFRLMMVEFTVYNKIMIYFPWFIFFIGLFSLVLGIVNFQRSSINTPEGELNY